jgi:uncharacterized protein YyaL (SSP411 family)
MRWLAHAHDATGGQGISYGYGLVEGWWPPYPETTGYCVPTFLEYARWADAPEFRERARSLAEWELTVQLPNGGISGGPVKPSRTPTPVAFDTGQVLQGFTAMYQETKEEKFLTAACKAADYLLEAQAGDGAWYDVNTAGQRAPHCFNARTAWALLELTEVVENSAYRLCATRNLDWVLNHSRSNGWFEHNAFAIGAPALTHTIAYVMEGLIGCAVCLRDERALRAARVAADALLREFSRAPLRASYDGDWQTRDRYACVTGCAQIALVWLRLFTLCGEEPYRQAALRMNRYVQSRQVLSGSGDVRGALPGSDPIYGAYERFRFPNWAAKFAADSMLAELKVADHPREQARKAFA